MSYFEEGRTGSVKLTPFPPTILELLRSISNDAGDQRRVEALTALRWIAAAYGGYDSSAYLLNVYYKNPFQENSRHFCITEAIQGRFAQGEAAWEKAVKAALTLVCKRERRCKGTVIAASLRQEVSQRINVFQPVDWGGEFK
ncbi:hypothetical protein L0936_19295 [Paracidovorax citrulli]